MPAQGFDLSPEGWDSALLEIVFQFQRAVSVVPISAAQKSESSERNYRMLQSRRTLICYATDKNDATNRIVVASQDKSLRFLATWPIGSSSSGHQTRQAS